MNETRKMIDEITEQYNLYIERTKPYQYTLTDVSIITKKATELYINLVKEYFELFSIPYQEISVGRFYTKYKDITLEIFINQGNCAISDTEHHRTYYMQSNLEILDIYYGYNVIFIDTIDSKGKGVETVYNMARTGQLTLAQMMEFLAIMQKNLLTLNEELHYLTTHSLPKDYKYELVDTVNIDEQGEALKYNDFGIIWQMVKNKIDYSK